VALALVCGGSAAIGINKHLIGAQTGGTSVETVPVVVAAVPISRGMTVTADMLAVKEYPKSLVPEGSLSKSDDAVDRSALTGLSKDEPLLESKLVAKGSGRGFAALIPDGMRAVTILTPNLGSSLAGLIVPGNRVDVLFTPTASDGGPNDPTGGGSTTTLLQNIEILAVDKNIEAPPDSRVDTRDLRSVTLLVTPNQGTQLNLAQNKGILQLALRNPRDGAPAATRVATLAALRYQQGKPWDERLKDVLMAVTKQAASKPQAPQAEKKSEPESPSTAIIMTLHGMQQNELQVPLSGSSK
jgi:pilus assembly protein CpaB